MTVNLYIKQHRLTGLRYFGKTTRDPLKYNGSGLRWRNHIKAHGKDIDTIWTEQFDDAADAVEFAEFFSDFYNIVDDPKWANLIAEDSKGGGSNKGRSTPWLVGKTKPVHSALMKIKMLGENNPMYGKTLSVKHRQSLITANTGRKGCGQPGNQHGKGNLGKIQSPEWRLKKSLAAKANWAKRKAQQEQQ